MRQPLSLLCARLAAALTTGALVATAGVACGKEADPLPNSTKITITGHGNGHGHGMAQWGAQGAAKKGKSYRQILSFYYPGTRWGTASGNLRVLIGDDTTRDVLVSARSGLRARAASGRTWKLAHLHPNATRWRIVPVSATRDALEYKTSSWHRQATATGTVGFTAGGAAMTLLLPHGKSASYRGTLRSVAPRSGSKARKTVNVVSLDNYLAGVVPAEVYSSWKAAALKAQAVAARSYAVYQRVHDAHGWFDVYDDTRDQAYDGAGGEASTTTAAVKATSGKILTYGGSVAFTQFSASNGGYMLAGSVPYLVSKRDPYDAKASGDPSLTWTKKVTVKQIRARWPSAGKILSVKVTKRVSGTGGRYVKVVTVEGQDRTYQVSGDAFRSWAGLSSTWFSLKTG
ncbi:MAG: SpoIID/LytB domain-containing protein [Nocardioides sp.]|uniref:SpoIID/LytB domain-containing protein n=1 Tax=Nocardioides sp. TaxID=35761 RepID=UPI0039E50E9B